MHFSALAALPFFVPASHAWLLEFWGTQSNCNNFKGQAAADTTRGGQSCQSNTCMMLGLEATRSIKISDWDDTCRVALWNLTGSCREGEQIWSSTKKEMADTNDLVDNNWSCVVDVDKIAGGPIYYAGYICE